MKKRLGRNSVIVIIGIVVIAVLIAMWSSDRKENTVQNHQPGSMSLEEHSEEEEPEETTESETSVTLSTDEWKEMVLQALDCEGEEANMIVTEDHIMTIDGELPKSTIEQWLSSADPDLSGMYTSILALLPESLPMSLMCEVTCSDGQIELIGTELSASDIDVPMDMLSDTVWDSINSNLNDAIHEKIAEVNSITFQEESVILEA